MTTHKYHIGTGYHATPGSDDFFCTWYKNTLRFSEPKRITVLSDSGSLLPFKSGVMLDLNLDGNLGHFMQLVNGQKAYAINGWSGAIVTLALIAYCDECDFIFKEQDCLAFGPWAEKMYDELGTAKGIWGSCSFMPCEQSLFLVMHDQIPQFVQHYLDGPPQNRSGEFGEDKFKRMEEKYPDQYRRFSFGCGRDRPILWDDPVFYFQQAKPEDVAEAKRRGLA
jgi:hypothetical protein